MENTKWLKEKASTLMDSGVYEDAIPFLDKILELPGSNPYDLYFAHFSLGQIYFTSGRWNKADRHLKSALEVNGDDTYLMMLLGQANCALGKLAKARAYLENAIKIKPGDTPLQISFGICLCLQKEHEEAEEIFRSILRKDKSTPDPYFGLAQSLIGQHKWDEAKALLEEAKKQFPNVLVIRQILRDLNKLDEIENVYNWFTEDAGEDEDGNDSEWLLIPIELAKTAMVEYEFSSGSIKGAEKMWDDFTRISQSIPRAPEIWAAGIVYTMSKLFKGAKISQSDIARKFETNPSGVSRVYKTISTALKLVDNDPRYRGGKN